MKSRANSYSLAAGLFVFACLFTACESTDGGGSHTSVYYGSGFYDPWYHGDVYYDDDIIVTPPDGDRGPRPSHPIALPPGGAGPRPTPSIPTAMPRGGGGRR
jgi:hypothetical protein